MPPRLEFGCLPTGIGSLPHTDPEEACSVVMKFFPDIPVWPQLPRRSHLEDMVIQFSQGFPGVVVEADNVRIEESSDFAVELEQVYADYERGEIGRYGVSPQYAPGLYTLLSRVRGNKAVKGQITGPITWGLRVHRQDGLGIIYDETLSEAAARFLGLKARWQENILGTVSSSTIIFVDEPYLVSLGSVFKPIPEENVPFLLREVMTQLKGIKGLHCCGNTDWSVVLKLGIDILSFDAYNYASSLSAHCDEVRSFLESGGGIAWGIVPNDEEALAKESVSSICERLGEAIDPFTRNGKRFKQILAQALITPSCGLASLSPEAAYLCVELTAKVSQRLKSRYGV